MVWARVQDAEGLVSPSRVPTMQELEGYWELKSVEIEAFGGNPVFELRADGTFKFPSRYGKPKLWRIQEEGRDFWLEIKLLDNLSTPITLRGRLMLSEYFPMVVERGEVLKPPRSAMTSTEQVAIGEFQLRRIT
ncbi:hypothetical protein KFE25_008931 [Diacronema lutheri]|uniref:Uncharacterized protein n=1 Tax=Diacronema lutheri TaxID=2081491 RepID=A0A8J6CHR0_DIALT|nr:hypothetical protein KFE25_008931 [Diacronema lutheri]